MVQSKSSYIEIKKSIFWNSRFYYWYYYFYHYDHHIDRSQCPTSLIHSCCSKIKDLLALWICISYFSISCDIFHLFLVSYCMLTHKYIRRNNPRTELKKIITEKIAKVYKVRDSLNNFSKLLHYLILLLNRTRYICF